MRFAMIIGLASAALLTAGTMSVHASNTIVSKQGGKCLNAEGGARDGARLIAYNCSGAANEDFRFERDRLVLGSTGLCAQADSRNQGSEVHLRKCDFSGNGTPLQNFGTRQGNT